MFSKPWGWLIPWWCFRLAVKTTGKSMVLFSITPAPNKFRHKTSLSILEIICIIIFLGCWIFYFFLKKIGVSLAKIFGSLQTKHKTFTPTAVICGLVTSALIKSNWLRMSIKSSSIRLHYLKKNRWGYLMDTIFLLLDWPKDGRVKMTSESFTYEVLQHF